MSKEVLLINPRRRRRKTSSRKRRRNPARRPVRRAARGYTIGRAPIRRRKLNPSRRRRTVSRYKRRVMRRRSNPIRASNVLGDLMPAIKGASGAILTETAFRFLPTPGALAMLKGTLAPVTKIGVAYGIAMLAKTFGGRRLATDMLSGSLVVIAYDFINQQVLSRLPMVGVTGETGEYLSGLGYHSAGSVMPALPDGSGYDDGMSAYMDESSVGEYIA